MVFRNKEKLIVVIDYGTTYSGLSYTFSNASDITDIKPWLGYPGASTDTNYHSAKAPTRIAFAGENPDLDRDAWGYQVEPGMKAYAWMKLFLDKDALQSKYDDPSLANSISRGDDFMRLPPGKSAVDVTAQFLKGMYDMFEEAAIQILGENQFVDTPIDCWISVPATWGEKAKLLTKVAALEAGFASKEIDRIMLIPEPEAAALWALKSDLKHFASFAKAGARVMVCDCGGGTVDITSYEIQRTDPTLKLREVAVGAAGKCGGIFVDLNFLRLMTERFGSAFTSLETNVTGPGSHFMDQFENKKRGFSLRNPSKKPHQLTLAMPSLKFTPENERYYNKRGHAVLLSSEDLQYLFDPVIDKIEQLLEDQVNEVVRRDGSPIDTMILVGGFGSSPYLKERLRSWCAERKIRLTTPLTGGWSAIACGAVLRGLEGSIVREKRCRRHYGYSIADPYNPSVHAGYDKSKRHIFRHRFYNEDYLTGFIQWSICKGAVIHPSTEIESHFENHFDKKEDIRDEVYLYSCSLDDGPPTIENDRVEIVGMVKYLVPLNSMDLGQIPSRVDEAGITWYNIKLQIRTRLDDESGHLVFSVHYNGKEVGRAKIEISSG